jgi:hypothetical protein
MTSPTSSRPGASAASGSGRLSLASLVERSRVASQTARQARHASQIGSPRRWCRRQAAELGQGFNFSACHRRVDGNSSPISGMAGRPSRTNRPPWLSIRVGCTSAIGPPECAHPGLVELRVNDSYVRFQAAERVTVVNLALRNESPCRLRTVRAAQALNLPVLQRLATHGQSPPFGIGWPHGHSSGPPSSSAAPGGEPRGGPVGVVRVDRHVPAAPAAVAPRRDAVPARRGAPTLVLATIADLPAEEPGGVSTHKARSHPRRA